MAITISGSMIRDRNSPGPGITHGSQLNASNVGPEAAGYSSLTAWSNSYLISGSNQLIEGYRFTNVGPQVTGNNVTFRGCEFRETGVDWFVVRLDGTNTTFEDCRWRPDATSSTPVTRAQSYQQGIKMFNGVGLTVKRCEFWGFGNAIEFETSSSTVTNPILVEDTWMHDAADQAGSAYHHDGLLCSYEASYVTVRRCKIVSGGNTNALAFQTPANTGNWTDLVIEDNAFGGFGYTVNLGDDQPSANVTFTGNIWDHSITPEWGVFKNNWAGFTGTNVWSGNTHSTGGFWWPTDETSHGSDY